MKARKRYGRRDESVERARKAFNRVDRLLSEAEGVIGTALSSVTFREHYPSAFKAADDAFTHIERARRSLAYRR